MPVYGIGWMWWGGTGRDNGSPHNGNHATAYFH
nr:MAG TPA: hypothetical protein [Caudoviricetes sp.]